MKVICLKLVMDTMLFFFCIYCIPVDTCHSACIRKYMRIPLYMYLSVHKCMYTCMQLCTQVLVLKLSYFTSIMNYFKNSDELFYSIDDWFCIADISGVSTRPTLLCSLSSLSSNKIPYSFK